MQPGIEQLVGKTLADIQKSDYEIVFITDSGDKYKMYHDQSCCESVRVDDINGDLSDLIGSPILKAEQTTSHENPVGLSKEYQDSFTWTFYHIATIKGYITIRWYGESNGHYSETVEFEKLDYRLAL